MRVNMNTTKVMISGKWQKVTLKAVRWPCGVCGRGESKVLPEPYGPLGGAELRSIGPQPDTSLHCKDRRYGASASRGVSVYSPAVRSVPNYTAW